VSKICQRKTLICARSVRMHAAKNALRKPAITHSAFKTTTSAEFNVVKYAVFVTVR
jgi:hypothetical protein